jgi:hypothetical protein
MGLSAASAVSTLLRQRPLRDSGGCAFPDGLSYCRIALGLAGRRPFNQRPLVPLAARATRARTLIALAVVAVAVVVSNRRPRTVE